MRGLLPFGLVLAGACDPTPASVASTSATTTAAAPRASHLVVRGDTLEEIARGRYGSRHYAEVLARVNHLAAERLPVGASLALPSIDEAAAPLGARVTSGTEALLRAHATFRASVASLWDEHRRRARRPHPELARAAADAETARAAFAAAGAPTTQLGSLVRALEGVGSGTFDPEGYAIDDVDRRFAYALAALLGWAGGGSRVE